MKTYDIDCYVVECPDGGGMYNIRVGLFSTKVVADEYAKLKGKSWPHSVKEYKESFIVFDTIQDVETYSKEKLVKSALAKLTAAEKKALGV
jgi:threonine synthase